MLKHIVYKNHSKMDVLFRVSTSRKIQYQHVSLQLEELVGRVFGH